MVGGAEPLRKVLALVRKGEIPPILVTRFEAEAGEDLDGRDLLVQTLRRAVLGPEPDIFGETVIDAPTVSLTEVLDSARQVSLMSPKRLVLVRGSRVAAGSGDEGEAGEIVETVRSDAGGNTGSARGGDAAEMAVLDRYLSGAASSACILFVGSPWDARRRVHKALLGAATVVDVGRPAVREIPFWIEERVREAGGRIEPEAATALAELRGNDTMRLRWEIEKLLIHAGEERRIGPDDIEALIGAGEAGSAWALVDAMVDGDAQKAILTLRRLIDDGEPVPAIVGAIASRLRQMVILRDEKTTGRPNEGARQIAFPGRSIYFADALGRKVGRLPPHSLVGALSALYDVDKRSKSTTLEGGALIEEWLVSSLKTWGFVPS